MSRKGESSRTRAANFSQEEQVLLTRIIDRYSHIIESTKADNIKHAQKQETWGKITEIYNAHTVNMPRTTESLISCYRNMKSKRKQSAQHSVAKTVLKDKGEPSMEPSSNLKYPKKNVSDPSTEPSSLLKYPKKNVSDSLMDLTEEKLELVRLQKRSQEMKIEMQQLEMDDLTKQNQHKEEMRKRELIHNISEELKIKIQKLEMDELIKQNQHKEEIRKRELILLDLQIKQIQ